MQRITISGTLLGDTACFRDKNDRQFIRFTVTCGSTDIHGRTVFNHYRCTCYITSGYENMKKGDQVFIMGKFLPSIGVDDKGKPYLNLDVMVTDITGGYRATERKKKQQ